jgi:hypothetical protein
MSGEKEYQCILEELHRLKKSNDTLAGVIENQSVIIARQEALIKTLLAAIEGINKFETPGK